jgi:hypothetical protein
VAEIDEQRTGKVVVKPRRTTIYDGSSVQQKRIDGDNYVEADADLVDHYRTLLTRNPSLRDQYPLVQAFVDGAGTMATVGLVDDGEFCSVFQHEKFRVYPPSGGIGAVRKGVDEPLMRRYAERVVDALGWTGPCHVEFMRTPDGDFHLLEVNGRYWGSLALTINSGVDVPWHHYQLLTGDLDSAVGPPTYATDIRQRKLFYQDIRWLRDQLERGNLGALVPFVTSFFNTRDEFLCPEDLTPLLGLLVRTAMIVSRRQSEWG